MTTLHNPSPGLARRILCSPPARVLIPGFILLLMMGLNEDVMTSYADEPLKSIQHIMALAIAGLAVYIGYGLLVEQRDVRAVETWFGSWVALVVSSLVFGLTHLINPQATLEGALFIAVEAGTLLAAAYMLTLVLCTTTGVVMLTMAVKRGNIVPPIWKRPTNAVPEAR